MLFTQGKTHCKPGDIGYNEERLDVLHHHFQKLIDAGDIQCASYCLARKGQVFAHGAIGSRSYKQDMNDPMLPDTINSIASITKTFTAVAIMKLVDDGLICLDENVGAFLPQFNTPPYNGVTLFQLLTHTSGMYADGGCFENQYQTDYWDMIDAAYELHKLKNIGSEFDWIAASLGTIGNGFRVKPNTEWAYCSFGFTILGAVIEKVTGINAHQYIEDHIAKPLGMSDTAFELTPETAKRAVIQNKRREDWYADIINGREKKHPVWDIVPSTGGGLKSTPYDLIKYANMMLYGGTSPGGVRIIGRKCVEKMTTRAIYNKPNYCWGANEPDRGYGIGFDMRNGPQFTFSDGTFMHEGAGACAMYIDPKEELTAAWLVPYVSDGWVPKAMYNTLNIIWSGLI